MTAGMVVRSARARVVACLTIVAMTACDRPATESVAPRQRVLSAAPLHDTFVAGDTSVTRFTIDPSVDAWYTIAGGHYLYVEKNGVCDHSSPYGPDYWNTDCTPSTAAIGITAKSWTDAAGHPRIDFQPALRFVIKRGRIKTSALLFMYDTVAAKTPGSTILYCTQPGACVDEGVHDRLLRTDADRKGGYLFRQIKHFSGYEVATGFHAGF